MKLLLIGNGKWAQRYIATARALFIDLDVVTREWRSVFNPAHHKGVIICTPPDSHVDIALDVLKSGTPVLIEKPLCLNYEDSLKLLPYDSSIIVNHIHLFSNAFQALVDITRKQGIARIYSGGGNQGPFRSYSSFLDYASHDIAMSSYLLSKTPHLLSILRFERNNNGEEFFAKLSYKNVVHRIFAGNGLTNKWRSFSVTTTDGHEILYDDTTENKLFINREPQNIKINLPLQGALESFLALIDGIPDDRLGLGPALATMKIFRDCKMA